jgi:shikimate dehydrogenase
VSHAYVVGLIGAGVGPSLTPRLHMTEAQEHGIVYVYRTIDLPTLGLEPADVVAVVRYGRLLGFDAFNLTHPCKQLVLEHLDRVDPGAAALGAVNTVVFEQGQAVGYNTDTTGFATSFTTGLAGATTDDVVMLGAGGAGAAIADALLRLGTRHLTIVDIDESRSAKLVRDIAVRFPGAQIEASTTERLSTLLPNSDGLVHCTPTGMTDHPGLPLPAELLHPGLWIADIVYRPLDTALVQAAREIGCRTLDGGGMAVHQAVDAFALITGITPDADRMMRHFRQLVDADA